MVVSEEMQGRPKGVGGLKKEERKTQRLGWVPKIGGKNRDPKMVTTRSQRENHLSPPNKTFRRSPGPGRGGKKKD